MNDKLTVKLVSERLGIDQLTLRVGLQQGRFPFGTAYKLPNSTHYTYIFYPKILDEYI